MRACLSRRGGLAARSLSIAGALLIAVSSAGAHAAVDVRPQQSIYSIQPGATFSVEIVIDGNDQLASAQPLSEGLFSYGVLLEFDPTSATVASAAGVIVPSALDFFGFNLGAQRAVGSGFAAVKGNIDQGPFVPYDGTVLATFVLQDRGTGQPYTIDVKPYRTLGATEQLFLTGMGSVIDAQLRFSPVQVSAVPEASAFALLGVGLAMLFLTLRRQSPAKAAPAPC